MEVPEKLILAANLARKTASEGGDTAHFASEMLKLLDEAIVEMEATNKAGIGRPARRGSGNVEYLVEGSGAGETLAEHRRGGKSQPHRCPRPLYDAVAQVLAGADRPLAVEEIMVGVEKMVGGRPAEFQVRVPLRFWITAGPPLVVRMRARYRATDTQGFAAGTEKLWADLRVR
jgi:hypothetical protein